MGDEDINFDLLFYGFTQLYPTAHEVTAEYGPLLSCTARMLTFYSIIAITGLWVVEGKGQPWTNVASRLPLERPAKLPNDDLRL